MSDLWKNFPNELGKGFPICHHMLWFNGYFNLDKRNKEKTGPNGNTNNGKRG